MEGIFRARPGRYPPFVPLGYWIHIRSYASKYLGAALEVKFMDWFSDYAAIVLPTTF